ncbi:MAG: methyltransferase, partial [Armatimonadetes bacterium]|nr:methyltransferase [Armatimonadota bacterium]
MSRTGSADHYFAAAPRAPHRVREVQAWLRGREFRFATDRGVFARGGVDRGTRLLIEAMEVGPGDDVLDLGCGYGPVGLVAAALAERGRAWLVDINERAAALA